MSSGSLTLEREGQIELEGILEKVGGTLPTGDCWRKIFPAVAARRLLHEITTIYLTSLRLGVSLTTVDKTILSDCPKSIWDYISVGRLPGTAS